MTPTLSSRNPSVCSTEKLTTPSMVKLTLTMGIDELTVTKYRPRFSMQRGNLASTHVDARVAITSVPRLFVCIGGREEDDALCRHQPDRRTDGLALKDRVLDLHEYRMSRIH